jgi:hypothetical protein
MKYEDGSGRKWEAVSHEIDWTAKVVCAKCNNGWMSKIEGEQPIQPCSHVANNVIVALHQELGRRPSQPAAEQGGFANADAASNRKQPNGITSALRSGGHFYALHLSSAPRKAS